MVDIIATVNAVTRLFPKPTLDALRAYFGGAGVGSYTQDVPAGAAGKVTITHNLGTRFVSVVVFDTSVDPWLDVKVPVTSPAGGNTVILNFGSARTAGQYKVAVIPLGASSTPTTPTPTPGVAPSIATTKLEPMTQGLAFEQQLIASGDAEITWTVVSGAIPGISLSTSGKLTGQPTNAGNYTLRVRAVNGVGSVERTFTGTIAAPPVASSWSSYTSDSFAGTDTADINGRTTDLTDGGVSKQWVTSNGAYGIASGALVATGTVSGGAFVPLASTACEISAVVKTMPNSTAETHLFAMELSRSAVAASGVTGYRVRMYATGNLAITRLLNGVETSDPIAISEPSSFVVGSVVTFRRVDSADRSAAYLSVRVDDREVAAYVDDSPLPAGSYAGFFREGRTGSFDSVSLRTQSTTVSAPSIQATQLNLVQGSPASQQLVASGDPIIVFSSISGKPAGLSLSDSGMVTGVPSGTGAFSWVIRATNAGGSSERTFTGTISPQGGSTGGGLVFGAEGRYTASFTPKPTDTFDRTIEVDPTWSAIAAGVRQILAETAATAKTRILMRPGKLPAGFSAGSSARGVLENLGSADRTWNILVMPRDGLGTVTGTAGGPSVSCAFVNVNGITILGVDFSGVGLMIRNSNRFIVSHSFANIGNFTANGGGGLKDCEYVECVFGPGDTVTDGTDRCAQRTENGFSAINSGWIGCYMATVQRRAGQTGHCDTIQLSASGNSPDIGTRIIGCVLWSSANQAFIATETPHVQQLYVEKTLTIAGASRINMRYPQTPRDEGGEKPTELYQTLYALSFVGGAVDITSKDNIFIGSVADGHTWKSVVNTKVSEAQANKQGTGAFTLDTSLQNITKEQLDELSPYPTVARQRALWNRQLGLAA